MRDKQIEEITVIISEGCEGNCKNCDINNYEHLTKGCYYSVKANRLYNAGYRKASDVEREIFEEIEKIEKRLLNRQKKCDKEAQKAGWYLEVREAYEGQSEGIGLCLDYLAELKKKYESEGEK